MPGNLEGDLLVQGKDLVMTAGRIHLQLLCLGAQSGAVRKETEIGD